MNIAATTLRNCIGTALSVALPRALLPRTGQCCDAGRGDEEEDWSIQSALCSETLQRFCPYMEPRSVSLCQTCCPAAPPSFAHACERRRGGRVPPGTPPECSQTVPRALPTAQRSSAFVFPLRVCCWRPAAPA